MSHLKTYTHIPLAKYTVICSKAEGTSTKHLTLQRMSSLSHLKPRDMNQSLHLSVVSHVRPSISIFINSTCEQE